MIPSGQKKVVLIVDDAPANIHMARAILKDEYETRVATHGAKALELVAALPRPDLVLLDVSMPDLDGYEVCRRIKSDPATAGIPVVFLTSMTESEDETLGFQVGAVDYIHKPFSSAVMLARVRTHLTLVEAREHLAREKALVDRLLDHTLPAAAVAELKTTGRVSPRRFDRVGVLFVDLVGFTSYCDGHPPEDVVGRLAEMFVLFEESAHRHGLEKIKTIGDAFLATANLLHPNEQPLEALVACAADIATRAPELGWEVRAGACVGPLMAGIVGRERYQFDIWGDTVNVASRLTSAARPGTVALLEGQGSGLAGREVRPRGAVELKGKGSVPIVEVTCLPSAAAT